MTLGWRRKESHTSVQQSAALQSFGQNFYLVFITTFKSCINQKRLITPGDGSDFIGERQEVNTD